MEAENFSKTFVNFYQAHGVTSEKIVFLKGSVLFAGHM
jgi:hypothetical protein